MVEVDGIEIGGFSDVSGLELKLETDDVREGGNNDFVHKIPKHTTYPNLTLKRGISDSVVLWAWCMTCVQGAVLRQMLSVVLKKHQQGAGKVAVDLSWTLSPREVVVE